MTKLFITAIALFALALGVQAQSMKFSNLKDNVLEYGDVQQNGDGVRVIKVKNTGKAPLILSNVKASCGCTVPSYEKDPIMPGKTAEIKVKYATNRVGAINKTLTITSNDVNAPTTLVRLKGSVLATETVKSVAKTAVKQ